MWYHLADQSDDERDGMFLELFEAEDSIEPLLRIFYCDHSHTMHITHISGDVPLPVVGWAIREAADVLPPKS